MRVDLTYFKDTGKYYSSGSYTTDLRKLFEIFREVRAMVNKGRLPGLCDGAKFNTLIDVPEHEHNHPQLIMVEDSKDKIEPLFQVGEEVHDDLTRTKCKVIGISYMNGYCGNPLENNYGCWGIWIDSDYCDGGRHPWELTKVE